MNEQQISAQEVFNTVVDHLRQQGSKSLKLDPRGDVVLEYDGTTPACMYRSHDGKKCAVGCLILDEEYKSTMEGWGVSLLMSSCISFGERMYQHQDLLTALQKTHDQKPVDKWEQSFEVLARAFGLHYVPPSK